MTWQIDPDLRKAHSLPAHLYGDPAFHDQLREAVFARAWHFVADRDAVRVPGHVLPFTLLEGAVEEPLLLARDRDDQLRCLSNVCTHRGMLVCEHEGTVAGLRCRYHGRRFGLDGCFRSMPEFEETAEFPSPRDDLAELPLAHFGRFLFAALDPAIPFETWSAPLSERLGWLPFDDFRFEPSRSRDYLVEASWMLYCDNFLEGFHIPFVHAGLATAIDYGAYRTELFPWGNLQLGIAEAGSPCFELPPGHPDEGERVAAWYFWLFPNLMINVYPWGISANVVKPLAPGRTRVSFLSWVWREDLLETGAGAELDRVEREDEAIIEQVQKGVRSRIYRRGRYSPVREAGVHQFHRLLADAVGAG